MRPSSSSVSGLSLIRRWSRPSRQVGTRWATTTFTRARRSLTAVLHSRPSSCGQSTRSVCKGPRSCSGHRAASLGRGNCAKRANSATRACWVQPIRTTPRTHPCATSSGSSRRTWLPEPSSFFTMGFPTPRAVFERCLRSWRKARGAAFDSSPSVNSWKHREVVEQLARWIEDGRPPRGPVNFATMPRRSFPEPHRRTPSGHADGSGFGPSPACVRRRLRPDEPRRGVDPRPATAPECACVATEGC